MRQGKNLTPAAADEFQQPVGSEGQERKGTALPAIPYPEPATGLMALRAVTRADVNAACERLHALAGGGEIEVIACDVSALAAEVAAVDALARLALVARRLGCPLKVRRASPELRDLVAFCGLSDALGVGRNGWEAEEREEPIDVQERVDPNDPIA
jgi:hypothetical protein